MPGQQQAQAQQRSSSSRSSRKKEAAVTKDFQIEDDENMNDDHKKDVPVDASDKKQKRIPAKQKKGKNEAKDDDADNEKDHRNNDKKMKVKAKVNNHPHDNGKPHAKKTTKSKSVEPDDNDEDEEDDTAACCLCHAAVDYSDMEWFGQGDDVVATLPKRWHDPNNALVYCDGCDRMYHQKCHFVPLLVLPRGDWYCLICQYNTQQQQQAKKKRKRTKEKEETAPTTTFTNTSIIYPLLTKDNYTNVAIQLSQRLEQYKAELDFEYHSRALKASLWKQELQVRFPRSVSGMVQSLQQAQTELETLTSSHRNRQYFIESTQHLLMASSMHSHKNTNGGGGDGGGGPSYSKRRIQQQLHQTVYQYAWRKFQLRQVLMNLSKIIQDTDQTWQELQCYLQHQPSSSLSLPNLTAAGAQQQAPPSPSQQHQDLAVTCFPFGQPMVDTSSSASLTDVPSGHTKQSSPTHRRYCRRRIVPRTREWKRHDPHIADMDAAVDDDDLNDDDKDDHKPSEIPQEIQVNATPTKSAPPTKKNGRIHAHQHASPITTKTLKSTNHKMPLAHNHLAVRDDDDDDSGISLDDLQCCICFKSEASDDNDLILCDGQGCCRAYHVHCLDPPPPAHVLEQEDDDWFCPMCSTLAQTLLQVQAQYLQDEDWQLQRQHRNHQQANDLEVASVKSWENAFQAFPEAPWQYETALLLKQGEHTEDTDRLLRQLLGLEQPAGSPPNSGGQLNSMNPGNDDDDDDEEEDPDFEMKGKDEEAAANRDHGNEENSAQEDDDSADSSNASLVDVSSVELEISDDELNALSGNEDSGSEEEDGDEIEEADDDADTAPKGNAAKSRRSRLVNDETNQKTDSDGGQLNRDNIIWGKRRRTKVDYRRLNDAIFGDLDDEDVAKIDDNEDFVLTTSSRKTVSTNSGSSSSSTSGESDDEDDSEDGNERENSSDIAPPPAKRRRVSQPRGQAGVARRSVKDSKDAERKTSNRKPSKKIKLADAATAKLSNKARIRNGYHTSEPKHGNLTTSVTAPDSSKTRSGRKATHRNI